MRFLAMSIVLAVAASPLAGQLPSWVRPGTWLRLTTDNDRRPVIATLVQADAESVIVQPSGRKPLRVAFSAVRSIDVSREHGNAAGKGLRIGFLTGFSFGALMILGDDDVGNKGLGVLAFGGIFGGIGAGLGGLIGAGVPTDQWVPLSPAATSFHPRVGVGAKRLILGLSLSL